MTEIITPPLNQAPAEYNLRDLLDLIKKEVKLEVNCHALAIVQSFDSANMTLTATMAYTQTFFEKLPNGGTQSYQRPYATMVDCPVLFLGGGTAGLSFPIAAEDECLICFNDRDLDNWFSGATTGPVNSNRLHSFSDAIAIVWNTANPGYDALRAVLYNGQTGVGVSATKVKIYNQSTTLNTVLQSLLTALNTFSTACGSSTTVGQVAAAGTALASSLSTVSTNIAGLLE